MEKATYDLKKIEHGEALSRAMQEAHANGKRISMEKETLEEFIDRVDTPTDFDQFTFDEGIRVGAKWQAERMYSEEDMIEFAIWVYLEIGSSKNKERTNKELFKEWFEQFKKK